MCQQIKYTKQGHPRFGCGRVVSESESVRVWVGTAREELRKETNGEGGGSLYYLPMTSESRQQGLVTVLDQLPGTSFYKENWQAMLTVTGHTTSRRRSPTLLLQASTLTE